jgi:glutaminyl-tRNA synthetase
MSTPNKDNAPAPPAGPSDFIRDIVADDLRAGKHTRIHTRFPPEPNGYLHIGHAKSICLNFGIAREFQGICNLRMDDTNPNKEDVEYVDSITEDVKWLIRDWADDQLGFKPAGQTPETVNVNGKPDYQLPPKTPGTGGGATLEPFYASDYFDQIYEYGLQLVKKGRAYVCDLSPGDTDSFRGDSTARTRSLRISAPAPGTESTPALLRRRTTSRNGRPLRRASASRISRSASSYFPLS